MRQYNSITSGIRLFFKPILYQALNLSAFAPNISSEKSYPSIRKLRSQRHKFAKLLQLPVSDEPILYYKNIHAKIVVSGLGFDAFLGNVLMYSYARCGCVWDAHLLFDKMPKKNLVSWTTMVTIYAQNDQNEEALMTFFDFRRSFDEQPNEFMLASVVRACTKLGDLDQGSQVHGFVIKADLSQNAYVGTSVIDFYAKTGKIDDARLVFDELMEKTSVTWTSIISGYVRNGRSDVSLMMFYQMRDVGIVPDVYALCSALSACSMLQYLEGGKQIHAYVLRRGTRIDLSLMNVLIDFYGKCGKMTSARRLFDQIVLKDAISWTSLIAGYMQNSLHIDAMEIFGEMNNLGWKADGFACASVLTSCGSLETLQLGRGVHAYAIKANLESDEFVRNSLIDMYSKCDCLLDARRVLDIMVERNVVSYNAMIEGFSRHEKLIEALDLFHEMRLETFSPNLLTFVSLLGVSSSSSSFAVDLSKQIHGLIIKVGIWLDVFAGSALIDVYSKCSFLEDARLVFEELNEKDIVVWNAMFSGYSQQSADKEALKLYNQFAVSGQKPNEFTYVALITVASDLVSLRCGEHFHNKIIKIGLDCDPFITNALVDMYAKCGKLQDARKLFDFSEWKDDASWNSIISTYAHHGKPEEALLMYKRMLREGLQPNYVTFVAVLSACSHAGLVKEGLSHFDSMSHYGIEPGTEHYASIVSLFGRAGKLVEAKEFIQKMPIKPEAIVWRSLLSACSIAGNIELGAYAAEMALSSDPTDSGSYTLLSNVYASKGMWEEVKEVRKRMESNRVAKEPGYSWMK